MIDVREVTNEAGELLCGELLGRAEVVHRELRPALSADYRGQMRRVFDGGGRMVVATSGDEVAGVAVYRIFEDTHSGLKLHVDDLVVSEPLRGHGVGRALLDALAERAREAGAATITLDSGTQRHRAHAFYFREGFFITSFNFKKSIT